MSYEGLGEMMGSWTMVNSDGFEEYLAAMGINFIIRKIAMKMKTRIELERRSETGVRLITKGPKHIENDVTIDGEVDDVDAFGNQVKVRASWDPVKKVMTVESNPASGSKAKKTVVERRINGDGQLVEDVSLPSDSIACHRYFNKEK